MAKDRGGVREETNDDINNMMDMESNIEANNWVTSNQVGGGATERWPGCVHLLREVEWKYWKDVLFDPKRWQFIDEQTSSIYRKTFVQLVVWMLRGVHSQESLAAASLSSDFNNILNFKFFELRTAVKCRGKFETAKRALLLVDQCLKFIN